MSHMDSATILWVDAYAGEVRVLCCADERARLGAIEAAARALLADVRLRHPGETLRCPYMRELENAIEAEPSREPRHG